MSSPDERVQCSMRIPKRFAILGVAGLTLISLFATTLYLRSGVAAAAPLPGANVRVTVDTGSTYKSADQLAGGSYSDGVLTRCGIDRRMQNEPTLAIDPRNTAVWTSGSNDYCTVPSSGDAWPGFYRSTDTGASWTDSLLPGYRSEEHT